MKCAIEDDVRQQQYQEYTADMQSSLLIALSRVYGDANFDVPSIHEIWNPSKKDTRTKAQIMNDLMARLEVKK